MMAENNTKTAKEDKDKWATPWWVLHFAQYWFDVPEFELDCAASIHNTKCENFISEEDDALTMDWNAQFCWLNPPYSNPLPFVEKAIEQSKLGKTVVMLLNVDNSTKWFSLCVKHASDIVFITEGRIPFIHNATGEEVANNQKPQMLVRFKGMKYVKPKLKTRYVAMNWIKEKGKCYERRREKK